MTDEDLANPIEETPLSRPRRSRFWITFVAIVLLGAISLIAVDYYTWKTRQNSLRQIVENEQAMKQQAYEEAMADTYGGETPYETLSLYIAAVKKGDYELASKYFISRNRDAELKSLNLASKENMTTYIMELSRVLQNIENHEGSYDNQKSSFAIRTPILVDFTLYPNKTWKIVEI